MLFVTRNVRSVSGASPFGLHAVTSLIVLSLLGGMHGLATAQEAETANDHLERGNAWYDLKSYDNAINEFTRAVELDPQMIKAYQMRGLIWMDKEDYDKAIADGGMAIAIDPRCKEAFALRGLAFFKKGEFDLTIADMSKVMEIDPTYALVYQGRGRVWVRKHEYGKAIADYDEAIRLAPQQPVPCNELAWLLATCSDANFRDGKRAFELAARGCQLTAWKHADNLDTLAAAYAECGDFEKAVEWQEKAIQLAAGTERNHGYEDRLQLYRNKKPCRE